MQSINLAYEWNDVALLTDQRAYTFICKTMLQIPDQTGADIQDIILVDWKRSTAQKQTLQFKGVMELQIGLLNPQRERTQLQVVVPLEGELEEVLPDQANGRLIYSRGKVAGNCLLLETVLQIARTQSLQRSQVILGQFQMEELLELPPGWPYCQDLLATMVAVSVADYQIERQQLKLTGEYRLALLYANEEQPGECLYAYEQRRPMTASIAVPPGLQELDRLELYYQKLTAQQLDDRHVLLAGEGVLCTAPVFHRDVRGDALASDGADGNMADCNVSDQNMIDQNMADRNVADYNIVDQNDGEQHAADQDAVDRDLVEQVAPSMDDGLTRQMALILQQLMEGLLRHAEMTRPAPSQDTASGSEEASVLREASVAETATAFPTEQILPQSVNPTEVPLQQSKEPPNHTAPSVVNCRGSRRANLSKYMRHLNSSVKGPKATRNIEIDHQTDGGQPDQSTEE